MVRASYADVEELCIGEVMLDFAAQRPKVLHKGRRATSTMSGAHAGMLLQNPRKTSKLMRAWQWGP